MEELTAILKKGVEGETAKEALNRLEKIIEIIQKEQLKVSSVPIDLSKSKPFFFQKITVDEIVGAENKLGVKFPPSYKDFIMTCGLFKLGSENQNYSRLLHPNEIGTLSIALEIDWDISWNSYNPNSKTIMDKIYYFAMGDEDLQLCWYHCFDYNTINEKTKEVMVLDFNQSDWEWMLDDSDIKPCEYNGFDRHVTNVVNNEIERILRLTNCN
ncbi:SMI1/KNR4 family protein [Aquimarina litoralis]|uniref:SMI1/KNR4 family protein n=1 Tax=Aquimarina litoralis TaxID=584605 RepID=UPI001C57C6B2|nr:SMI1/KNR4 family protein [Aquimarina litoralis]